uniref:hypothetical protein n=1 Tax=Vibrio vulnificus TaxID=672 RepID=UPI0019D49802
NNFRSNVLVNEGNGTSKGDVSAELNNPKASQLLAPIGTPAVKSDFQADQRSQTIKYAVSRFCVCKFYEK